jgi:CO dehydrogenase nickel-insertion accessory protein CooC1
MRHVTAGDTKAGIITTGRWTGGKMPERSLAGLRLGVFGKGGAGKSTLVVLLARALRRRAYSVLVLDADSTNVGLAQAMGLASEPEPLLEYFGGMVFSGGAVTCPVDDPTPLPGARVSLAQLPARYLGVSHEGIHLLAAGKLGALGPGAGCDGPIAKIARDIQVIDIGPADVTVVDFKAGFEDSARGALTTLDWALAVVDPTVAAQRMAIHLHRLVARLRAGATPAISHLQRPELRELALRWYREARVRGVLAVLNRVPDPGTEAYLRRALGAAGPPVIGTLAEDQSIGELWLRATSVHSARLADGVSKLASVLEEVTQEAPLPHAG